MNLGKISFDQLISKLREIKKNEFYKFWKKYEKCILLKQNFQSLSYKVWCVHFFCILLLFLSSELVNRKIENQKCQQVPQVL